MTKPKHQVPDTDPAELPAPVPPSHGTHLVPPAAPEPDLPGTPPPAPDEPTPPAPPAPADPAPADDDVTPLPSKLAPYPPLDGTPWMP